MRRAPLFNRLPNLVAELTRRKLGRIDLHDTHLTQPDVVLELDAEARAPAVLNGVPALRRLPVLIIWGMKDSAFKPYQLARWQQLLPGAAVARLADAGHWPHEEDPHGVIEEIGRFMN